jgi:CBS domain-containing protein
LRVKGGGTLFTINPFDPLADAVKTMSDHDIGSLVVMEHVLQHRAQCGELAGALDPLL